MNNRRGFTLVELVVAIAILGVIALIAIPTVSRIQNNNRDTKYVTYEKSILAASKAYTDAYDEDLFGATNTGCALINYSDLKSKDLISDIQLKGTACDKDEYTYVFVVKSKNGNYEYFSNIKCFDSSGVVYSHQEDNRADCGLEDGTPPEIAISFKPNNRLFHIGDNPKALIRLSDKGIGLKANQKVKYTWYKGGVAKTETKTLEFKNKNYQGSVSSYVEMPSDLENIDEPTTYVLKVNTNEETGRICDVDLNCTDANETKNLEYFVGALLIKYKAGGAKMINPHGSAYTVNSSNDFVHHSTNGYYITKIKYKGSADLKDYNSNQEINIRKDNHYIDPKKEWKIGSDILSQEQSYNTSKFGYDDDDLIYENREVEVEANWKPQVRITVTATNQRKDYDGTALNADNTCSTTSGTLMSGDRISCTCTGSQKNVGSSTKTLSTVKVLDSAGKDITYRYIVTKRNGTLTVDDTSLCHPSISGDILQGNTVTYANKSWTVVSENSSEVNLVFNGKVDNNGLETGTTGGKYTDATKAVGKWINANNTMKTALANDCLENNGSSSNNKENAPSDYYWLTSKSVYVPEKINRYDTTSHYFFAGYKRVDYEPTNSELRHEIPSSRRHEVAYEEGDTATLPNGHSTISFENDTSSYKLTSNYFANDGFMFLDAVNGKLTNKPEYTKDNSEDRMITKVWGRTRSGAWSSSSPVVIENTRVYRIKICGGGDHDETYSLAAKSLRVYKHKAPNVDNYTETEYSDATKDYRFIFAGRMNSTTSGAFPDLTRYYKLSEDDDCKKVYRYETDTSAAKQVYYRPYITLVR